MISTFVGILLLGSVYLALGCLASSLTRSQIIAAILTLVGGISISLLSLVSVSFTSKAGWQAQLFSYVDLIEHMQDFARGVIDTGSNVTAVSAAILQRLAIPIQYQTTTQTVSGPASSNGSCPAAVTRRPSRWRRRSRNSSRSLDCSSAIVMRSSGVIHRDGGRR